MLIGRKKEIERLNEAYQSSKSEFVAVYGRRRVGKTFLVRQTLGTRITFAYTGILGISTKGQIDEFTRKFRGDAKVPKDWLAAFHLLEDYLGGLPEGRKVIFLDELPWMDGHRSKFVQALGQFWNDWASTRQDIMLIVCGSASSWIIDKIFKNRGGLHNRVTYRIHLHPFTLHECELYSEYLRLGLTRNQILEGYMVMGGVPFYWSKLSRAKSMAQNINDLFFDDSGEFRYEFNDLYASMFRYPEKYIKVIEALATKKKGLTRDAIVNASKVDNNGQLSQIIENLIECGFVRKYCDTSKKVRDAIYQLVDCYTLFYYQFIKPLHGMDENYWLKIQTTPTYHTWCGLAFERVCLLHVHQIKEALGISGILANVHSWHKGATDAHPGVQIDMLIDRSDNVIDICEMKYAPDGYLLTASEASKIRMRIAVLSQYTSSHKGIRFVLITSNGVIKNKYTDQIQSLITADYLFAP